MERLDSMWVFIAGPFAGAIFAVIFYKIIYTPAFNRYFKNKWLINIYLKLILLNYIFYKI